MASSAGPPPPPPPPGRQQPPLMDDDDKVFGYNDCCASMWIEEHVFAHLSSSPTGDDLNLVNLNASAVENYNHGGNYHYISGLVRFNTREFSTLMKKWPSIVSYYEKLLTPVEREQITGDGVGDNLVSEADNINTVRQFLFYINPNFVLTKRVNAEPTPHLSGIREKDWSSIGRRMIVYLRETRHGAQMDFTRQNPPAVNGGEHEEVGKVYLKTLEGVRRLGSLFKHYRGLQRLLFRDLSPSAEAAAAASLEE